MKKLLCVLAIGVIASQAMAHRRIERRCSVGYRNGVRHETCRTVTVRHTHHDHADYGDGFLDGMTASSYLLSTTSDWLDGDDKRDAIENDMAITFGLLAEGVDVEISQEVRAEIEKARQESDAISDASDEEVLLYILSK